MVSEQGCRGDQAKRLSIRKGSDSPELANQVPNTAKVAEPQRLRSGWINGVKALTVSYQG